MLSLASLSVFMSVFPAVSLNAFHLNSFRRCSEEQNSPVWWVPVPCLFLLSPSPTVIKDPWTPIYIMYVFLICTSCVVVYVNLSVGVWNPTEHHHCCFMQVVSIYHHTLPPLLFIPSYMSFLPSGSCLCLTGESPEIHILGQDIWWQIHVGFVWDVINSHLFLGDKFDGYRIHWLFQHPEIIWSYHFIIFWLQVFLQRSQLPT